VVEALDVPGYLPSVLVAPADRGAPAPVVVVTHGAGGRPEPHCARYAELSRGEAFVLCTRGRTMNATLPPDDRGYFYDGHIELGNEVEAALGALASAYGARADLDAITFAGFSQGASMGILFLEQGGARAAHVRRILLVEGGAGDWTIDLASRLAKDGVDRVAIVCGQRSCHEKSERSMRWIEKAGLAAFSRYAEGAGHTDGGAVRPLVDEAWAWLVDGDERFSPRGG
jgi:hypothetical protein